MQNTLLNVCAKFLEMHFLYLCWLHALLKNVYIVFYKVKSIGLFVFFYKYHEVFLKSFDIKDPKLTLQCH